MMAKINDVFGKEITVVNVGLESMQESVAMQDVRAILVEWNPPKEGVKRLRVTKGGILIDEANQ
jgi:hypothetical protein